MTSWWGGWASQQLLNFSRKIYLSGPQQVPWGLIRPSTPKSLPTPALNPAQSNSTQEWERCISFLFSRCRYLSIFGILLLTTNQLGLNYWRKFGANIANTFYEIMLTMFQEACTDGSTEALPNSSKTYLWRYKKQMTRRYQIPAWRQKSKTDKWSHLQRCS